MGRKSFIALLLGVLLAAGAAVPGATAAGRAKNSKKGPVVVATDPADDWGANIDPTSAPLGSASGQEMVEASIEQVDKQTLEFNLTLASLPPTGGVPEFVRYVWNFTVDGELWELDGKWLNYSRGACDPTSGQCPPPRDPGLQPFILRTNCGAHPTIPNFNACEEVTVIQASFDTTSATITIPVSIADIGAKRRSKIVGGTNTVGGNISSSPAAFVSSGNMPHDFMVMTKTFVVR